ncbi:MAG: hypothetical protein ACUVTB_00365 [Candidatus Bathycorpusculaceae bacterium]
MVSKILKKMEALRGFIQIPTENIFELLGNTPLPHVTTLNGNPARIDKYGRLWSSFLKGKFNPGSRIQLIKNNEGFKVSLMENLHETKKENRKIKKK